MKYLILVLCLSACATNAPVPGAGINTGDVVEAPWGFTDLCRREPTAPECGGKQ